MSRNYHSRDYYEGYNRRRTEMREAKRKRKVRKVIREEERKRCAAAERFGSVAYWPCTRKKRFKRRVDAASWVRKHPQFKGLSIYRCDYCGGWHLTSHPRGDENDDAEPQYIDSE